MSILKAVQRVQKSNNAKNTRARKNYYNLLALENSWVKIDEKRLETAKRIHLTLNWKENG